MKVLFVLFLFSTSALFASTSIDDTVKNIRSKYEKVKKLESVMKVENLDHASGESAEGSASEIFRYKGEIVEIREEYLGESGKTKNSYFYEKGRIFFVFLEETKYSLPLMQPVPGLPKPTQTFTEHRFYFDNEKLIKWSRAGKSLKPSSKEFKERGEEVLGEAKKVFLFASKPSK